MKGDVGLGGGRRREEWPGVVAVVVGVVQLWGVGRKWGGFYPYLYSSFITDKVKILYSRTCIHTRTLVDSIKLV